MPVKSVVSIVRAENDVPAAVAQAMESAGWRDCITAGAHVAVKPNLGWDLFLPGAVTSPWVLQGVITTLGDRAGKITVVESDQVLVNCEKAARRAGVDRVWKDSEGVEWLNMSKAPQRRVRLDGAEVLRDAEVADILLHAELVSVPVMKTHNKSTITGAIKNQFGCLGKVRHNYHPVLSRALVEINRLVRPRLAVMDATVCLEGDAPKSGRPRVVGLVLASNDIVALDAVQATMMGFDPTTIEHLNLAAQAGLGTNDLSRIRLVGEPLDEWRLQFEPARDNLVSRVENRLRESRLRRIAFGGLFFRLCCWGALGFYLAWYYLGPGRHMCRQIVEHSPYGAQWR